MICECRRGANGEAAKDCDNCHRGECFEWHWEKEGCGTTVVFQNSNRDVIFNPGFSVGTAAVRGSQPFKAGYHHYWEIEMSTEVYGTDMMIGVGTDKTDLRKYSHNFVSFLGIDDQSWGLSYSGEKKHGGQSNQYSKSFGQYSIIGVHLDLWVGTLEFYIDRKPLGLAFGGLGGDKVLYPIISSTAARSGMNLIFCRSYPPSLQLQAMLALSQNLRSPAETENASLFNVLALPPGLKHWMKTNYWWIVSCHDRERKREEELNNRAKSDKKVRKQKMGGEQRRSEEEEEEGSPEDDEEGEERDSEGEDDDDDEETVGSEESEEQVPSRRRRHPREQQCAASGSGDTTCMRFLAAATSSRAHFLGRVSPIFVGMPDGGFSLLSSSPHLSLPPDTSAAGPSGGDRMTTRSCSTPAQPSSTLGNSNGGGTTSISRVTRQAIDTSSSEEDEPTDILPSARREPKRLRLRNSIEGNADAGGNGEEIEQNSGTSTSNGAENLG